MRQRPASAAPRRTELEGEQRKRPSSAVMVGQGAVVAPQQGPWRHRTARPSSASLSSRTDDFADVHARLPLRPASAFRFPSRDEPPTARLRRRPGSSLGSYRKSRAWEEKEGREGSFAYTPFFDTIDSEIKRTIAGGSNAMRLKIQSSMASLYRAREDPRGSAEDLSYQDLTKEMTRDLVIAQLEEEIRRMQQKKEEEEKEFREGLQELHYQKWDLLSKLRNVEKLNVFLRETMITGNFEPTKMDEIDHNAVNCTDQGPSMRTLLLHDAITKDRAPKQTFHRIVNPAPLPAVRSSHTPFLNLWVAYVDDVSRLAEGGDESMKPRALRLDGDELDLIQHWKDVKDVLSTQRHRKELLAMGCTGTWLELLTRKGKWLKMYADVSMEDLRRHCVRSNPLVVCDRRDDAADLKTEQKIHNIQVLTAQYSEKSRSGKVRSKGETGRTGLREMLADATLQGDKEAAEEAENASQGMAEHEGREERRGSRGEEGNPLDLSLFNEILQGMSKEAEKNNVLVQKHKDVRRRQTVQEQVERLLQGQQALGKFEEVVSSLDLQTRLDMMHEVAANLVAAGMVVRLLDAMRQIVQDSGLDETQVLRNLQEAAKELVGARHVRVWLTDEDNSKIWEWTTSNAEAQEQRSFTSAEDASSSNIHVRKRAVKPGIAADVARTGMGVNVPFPAVQSKSFSIEVDRLPGENARTILCEPIRHGGRVVAVLQCYNKVSPSGEEPFTAVDELLLRNIGELAGGLICKCWRLKALLEASRKALEVSSLTRHYPLNYQDLFLLAHAYTRDMMERVDASYCQLYISTVLDNQRRFLWSLCPAGVGAPMVVPHGVGIAGWVAEHEEAARSEDVEADGRFLRDVDLAYMSIQQQQEGEDAAQKHQLLALPLFNLDGSLLGVCSFVDKREGKFTETDELVMRVSKRMIEIVVNTSLANYTHFYAQETVFEALFRLKRLTDCDRAMLMVSEMRRSSRMRKKQLRLAAHSDSFIYERKEEEVVLPFSDGLFGYVARTGFDIVIPDAQVDPRFNRQLDHQLDYSTTSLLCIPVPLHDSEESVLGVLVLSNKTHARAFSAMDVAAAHVLRRSISYLYSNTAREKQT